LGAENQLFSEAAGLARAGDVERALAGFEQLVHDYPRSPLSQTALVRAFRLLAKHGRQTEAEAQARRYLEAYPTGFAVSEARALIRGATSAGEAPDESAP
jgi:outer membrane protein assembly factor BamD (BamD/ComL family)